MARSKECGRSARRGAVGRQRYRLIEQNAGCRPSANASRHTSRRLDNDGNGYSAPAFSAETQPRTSYETFDIGRHFCGDNFRGYQHWPSVSRTGTYPSYEKPSPVGLHYQRRTIRFGRTPWLAARSFPQRRCTSSREFIEVSALAVVATASTDRSVMAARASHRLGQAYRAAPLAVRGQEPVYRIRVSHQS